MLRQESLPGNDKIYMDTVDGTKTNQKLEFWGV